MIFKVSTKGHNDIIDITLPVGEAVGSSGIKTGLALVFVPHSTAAISSIEYETVRSGEAMRGFTIACSYKMGGRFGGAGGDNQTWVYILDKDGDYVWWYQAQQGGSDCVRARMSYNGKYMYVANGNVPGPNNGSLIRVSMDGLAEERFDLPRRHHDITVLPDETVVYFEYDKEADGIGIEGCDRVMTLDPVTGARSEIYVVANDFTGLANQHGCHSNAVNYVPERRALSLSILNFDTLILFSLSGDLIWTFGGPASDYVGASWDAQHQHHVMDDRILIFNNYGSRSC